jgi:hypothetical protein
MSATARSAHLRILDMSKKISLERLRDISRQRPIRNPWQPLVRTDEVPDPDQAPVEWPIRSSMWL